MEINEIRDKICKALRSTGRNVEDLIDALDSHGFFTAPCSGGNHLCMPGGNAIHSWNVCEHAFKLAKAWLSKEDYAEMRGSVIIASLLHDYGKVGDFGKPMYIPNYLKSGKMSDNKPYKRNTKLAPVPHAVRSIKLISQAFELTEDEEFAIMCHDGMYGELKYVVQGAETPLYLIVHTADMWCSRFVEASGADCGDDE